MLICVPAVPNKPDVAALRRVNGVRIASFSWLQSMIPDGHARSLIFDLDTAIQSLFERIGWDDCDTLKLTGTDRNLVRHRAEL